MSPIQISRPIGGRGGDGMRFASAPGIVTEVSAMLVEKMTFRVPGEGRNTRCWSCGEGTGRRGPSTQ